MNTATLTTERMTELDEQGELYAVFATTSAGVVRVTDPLSWNLSQASWLQTDDLRRAGRLPQVKHLEVRRVWLGPDRPLVGPDVRSHDRYDRAPLNLNAVRPVVGRGFSMVEAAARAAWRKFAPEFTDRGYQVAFARRRGYSGEQATSSAQGRGGWFYYPNGVTAAQGLASLAELCKRRGLVVQGLDGRWYPVEQGEL